MCLCGWRGATTSSAAGSRCGAAGRVQWLPCALPDSDIEALKAGLASGIRAEPYPFQLVGRRVRVKAGPLEGLQGIVVRKKNRFRLVISLDLIHRAAVVEVEAADLERI